MRRTTVVAAVVIALVSALAEGAAGASRIRVVTSLPDLKAMTEAVGGDLVEVDALARGSQNAHDVEVKPSLILKLRRADLLVANGLDLDFWIDALVRGANNARLLAGGAGRVDASRGIHVLEVPAGRVDRSMGDVHPQGNPHYTLDPDNAAVVTATIAAALARIAPDQRPAFERQRATFLERLASARARWMTALAPFTGRRIVVNHNLWVYFLARFGLEQAATIEERPGIPPSPAHVARLIRKMKDEQIKVIVLEPWGDRRLAERVATEAGATVVVLAHGVGALKGTDSYLDMLDHNVTALAQALR